MSKVKFNSPIPREMFDYVRNQTNRFSLRMCMTLMVCSELLLSAILAFSVVMILDYYFVSVSIWVVTLVFVAASFLISSVATAILSKLLFDPVKKLVYAMERVADGDFTVRLEDTSPFKETMEMYTGFNLMAHELGATEMLQSDFVSNVSHEFKTPINAIEGYTMLLQGSENLNTEQEEYIEKIVFNTRRLSSLVGSILLLSKLENQQIPSRQSAFQLDEQIRQSIVAMEPEWAEKDVEFDAELERIDYDGNEAMMRHVWDNLIGNAVKFGPKGGTIRICLRREEKKILFMIEDEGPGVSEEANKHIFDKFYQGDSSHKEEGNGLGLALVKRILTLEKGSITAKNLPEKGCRFTVVLPG